MSNKLKVALLVLIVSGFGAWYAFRTERLFINQKVNEQFPTASAAASSQLAAGEFHSGAHETKGMAAVFQLADGKKTLRLTNFATSNGPDVHVYLVAAQDAKDNDAVTKAGFVDLGSLKGNIGDQNYDLLANTGFSPVVFDSMQALGKNGVLVLSSVTGGDRKVEVPADKINLEFVLGNKVMVGTVNANREYFEMGVKDLAQAEAEYPGWLSRLLTHPVRGLENYQELFAKLTNPNGAIKVFCEIAEL